MKAMVSVRHAVHPLDFRNYTTEQLYTHFLIPELFADNAIQLTYSFYDRLIIGGAKPAATELKLETFNELKADFFLQRRELGIINVGDPGIVSADGQDFTILNKEALYIGRGVKEVTFKNQGTNQALFYFNSAPAHTSYPSRKVSLDEAETVALGGTENANHRTIRKLIVAGRVETCQLQMGLTDLSSGSIWNTMPPHTHTRRMEAYFYFNIQEGNSVCHFMGEPNETRHIWVQNNQAVISPPWSIHCGAGTSSYSFIWGMAGENLDYSDMDVVKTGDLR